MADNRTDKLDRTTSHGELTEARPKPTDAKPDAKPTDAKRQKPETAPDSDSMGGGSQGGM